jgi:hypothetical protein
MVLALCAAARNGAAAESAPRGRLHTRRARGEIEVSSEQFAVFSAQHMVVPVPVVPRKRSLP